MMPDDETRNARARVADRRVVWWIADVMVVTLLFLAPVLVAPHYGILDSAQFTGLAKTINVLDPHTYVFRLAVNRAAYGTMLYLFPTYLTPSVAFHFWFHSYVLLTAACMVIFLIIRHASGRNWIALAGTVVCLCNLSFVENYYTMFKVEPWMLTGAFLLTFVQWRLLSPPAGETPGPWRTGAFVALALPSALMVYALKEPGTPFLAVHLCGAFLFAWAYGRTTAQVLRRTWWLILLNIVAPVILIRIYMTLPYKYDAGSSAAYVFTYVNVRDGVCRLAAYFWQTAAYVVPGGLAVLCAVVARRKGVCPDALTPRIAWAAYLYLFFGAMAGILAPWTRIEPRYYLLGVTAATAATVIAADTAALLCLRARSWQVRIPAGILAASTVLLLLAHALYGLLVGPLSEGPVQYGFDQQWNRMFSHVARHTPSNGVAYFVLDQYQQEVIGNVPACLALFCNRPDIVCRFPQQPGDFTEPGLVACPLRSGPINYFRLPANESAGLKFIQNVVPQMELDEMTNFAMRVPILFATTMFRQPQYRSVAGIPAFWSLQHGTYEFGWRIYRYAGTTNSPARVH